MSRFRTLIEALRISKGQVLEWPFDGDELVLRRLKLIRSGPPTSHPPPGPPGQPCPSSSPSSSSSHWAGPPSELTPPSSRSLSSPRASAPASCSRRGGGGHQSAGRSAGPFGPSRTASTRRGSLTAFGGWSFVAKLDDRRCVMRKRKG